MLADTPIGIRAEKGQVDSADWSEQHSPTRCARFEQPSHLSITGDINEPKDEMERVGGRRLEIEVKVEALGASVFCMNDEASDADGPGCGQGRFNSGLKKSRSEPAPPVLLVHGHSRQDHGWNEVRHVSAGSTPDVSVGDRPVGERIEPDDSTSFDHDVRLGPAGDLVGQGSLLEPLVQLQLTAGEP